MIRVLTRSLLALSFACALSAGALSSAMAAETPKTFVTGLVNPESACYAPSGTLYVTQIGQPDKGGDGSVVIIKDGKIEKFAEGLDDPKGIVFFKDALYVTDKTKIVKVDMQGKTSVYMGPEKFPTKPLYLNDIAVDSGNGIFLVSDSGDRKGGGGAAYRIDDRLKQINTIASTKTIEGLNFPNGIAFDGESHFLLADNRAGILYRVKFEDLSAKPIADGLEGADGLAWDAYGRLFITSWKTGKTFAIPRVGEKPILIGEGLKSAADFCFSTDGKELIIPDMVSGTLTKLSTKIPGWEVDDSTLPVELQVAFPQLKWTGWDDGSDSGKANVLRPIVLTHAGDGSNRVFVATQHGVIHFFENSDDATKTNVFLDISERVRYNDKQNEEGFLGLAFHPKFKENGEFFVFYTDAKSELTNVVSRFRTKGKDHNVGDPASEEVLLRIKKPFWNHDGGSIAFGPDGYLYISHGDGGNGGDPQGNGQKLSTWLGKVLRIDVDKKADGKNYAIPADNPFVKTEGALPEIYAYGLRNVWRMAFDPQTKLLWGGEVGQNLFEEIILIKSGGNYGWNLREAFHPFGRKGVDVSKDLIEPIWEYHHDLGKSLTGGAVYRGKQIPALQGKYVYADYVSTKMWALTYDEAQKRVVANQPINSPNLAVISFGEDEQGEMYALRTSADGKGIYRLVKGK